MMARPEMFAPESPLRNAVYRKLFAAQLVALAGTGISTVALALLAFDLEPGASGRVLGTALAVKMVVYITVSLAAPGLVVRLSPWVSARRWLILLDLGRALLMVALPFVSQLWQVYALIAALSACSAAFKPVFQATLPAVLHNEAQYTRALSLTRLAYDLENVLSPALATMLLLWVSSRLLFLATAAAFLLSALWIRLSEIPRPNRSTHQQPLRGALRSFIYTPRLRAVLALNLCTAASGTLMIVSGVHYVRVDLGLGESALAIAMLATGAGSMTLAMLLPTLLRVIGERRVMLAGALLASGGALLGCFGPSFYTLLALWFALGATSAAIQTPVGRLITRSVHSDLHTAAFALQFSLSHACWLLTYGLAASLPVVPLSQLAFLMMGGIATTSSLAAAVIWRQDDREVEHTHDLPADHPHLLGAKGQRHRHVYVIDEQHQRWPEPLPHRH